MLEYQKSISIGAPLSETLNSCGIFTAGVFNDNPWQIFAFRSLYSLLWRILNPALPTTRVHVFKMTSNATLANSLRVLGDGRSRWQKRRGCGQTVLHCVGSILGLPEGGRDSSTRSGVAGSKWRSRCG